MSSSDPPSSASAAVEAQQQALQKQRIQSYNNMLRNLSIGLVIVCPAIMLTPPRKLDLYTLALGGTTVVSANYLRQVYFSQPRHGNESKPASSWPSLFGNNLPTERAREVQKALREKKGKEERGVLEKVWMGNETEGWKERRTKEDNEKLAQGEGIGDIIMEQVKEVFGSGKGMKEEKSKGSGANEWSENWQEREKAEAEKKGSR